MNEVRQVLTVRNERAVRYVDYARVFGKWIEIPAGHMDKFEGFVVERRAIYD